MFVSDFMEAFLLLVLSVPEGLPLIIILTLSKAAKELYQKYDVAIKDTNAIQTMGSVDTMLIDKTVNSLFIYLFIWIFFNKFIFRAL